MQARHIGKGPGFFVAIVVVGLSSASSRADVMYTVTGLGMLPGATSSQANAINNLGQIVGYCAMNPGSEAFLWTSGGGMQMVPTLGRTYNGAYGINNSGTVVGWSDTASGNRHAFAYNVGTGVQDLGVPVGSVDTYALSCNAAGQVVGESDSGAMPGGGGFVHAFLYTPGYGMLDLGTLGGNSQANGINDSGTVVGFSTTATSPYDHAFIYTAAGGIARSGRFARRNDRCYRGGNQ